MKEYALSTKGEKHSLYLPQIGPYTKLLLPSAVNLFSRNFPEALDSNFKQLSQGSRTVIYKSESIRNRIEHVRITF